MMKVKCLFFVVLMLIFSSCEHSEGNAVPLQNDNHIDNRAEDMGADIPDIFSMGSFEIVEELVEYNSKAEIKELPSDVDERVLAVNKFNEGNIGSADIWYGDGRGLSLNIKLPKGKGITRENSIIYYLPDALSNNLRIFNIECWRSASVTALSFSSSSVIVA